jgi:hypothetical protein
MSASASRLETAGREGEFDIIIAETPSFLRSLRSFTENLKPREETIPDENIDEDKAYLYDKLFKIRAACVVFNENSADEIITELRRSTWSHKTNDFLETIAEQVLHSDFDEIIDGINRFMA